MLEVRPRSIASLLYLMSFKLTVHRFLWKSAVHTVYYCMYIFLCVCVYVFVICVTV